MSGILRILLITGAIFNLGFVLIQIRKNKLKIEDSIFWFFFKFYPDCAGSISWHCGASCQFYRDTVSGEPALFNCSICGADKTVQFNHPN